MGDDAYHHGRLREALLEQALRACRDRGAAALGLRELAKGAGVSPAAVYRHFATVDHLRSEVARLCRQELAQALVRASEASQNGSADGSGGGAGDAVARFEAMGRAYVHFALEEPGWFAVAFLACGVAPSAPEHPSAWAVLSDALDELVAEGHLAPERRPEAAMIAWSAVHGLGVLMAAGAAPADSVDREDVVDAVTAGIQRALGLAG